MSSPRRRVPSPSRNAMTLTASVLTTRPKRSRARCRSARTHRRQVAFGLYAEQLSGSAFTAPRAENLRSWLYRLRPSAMHRPFRARGRQAACAPRRCREARDVAQSPALVAAADARRPTDFVDGLATYATCGESRTQHGAGIHAYCANRSMEARLSTMPTARCSSCRRKARSRSRRSWAALMSRRAKWRWCRAA